jgi:dipeptidyl-peptidase-4
MRKILVILFSIGVSLTGLAQEKMLTLQDAILGYHLYPKGLEQLQFAGNSHYVHVVDSDGEKKAQVVEIEEKGLGAIRMYSLDNVNEILHAQKRDSIKSWPRMKWLDNYSFRFYSKGEMLKIHLADKTVEKIIGYDPAVMGNPDFRYEEKKAAYTFENNLYILDGEDTIQITQDGKDGLVYGQAVHRYEFGITKGTFWSSDASKLAFYRMDESMVTEYPLYALQSKPATHKNIRYPVAGDPSHHVTVGVYDVNNGKTIYLKTGEPKDQYLTNVSWGPNGKFLYIAVVNRDQNHMWLKQYDAQTGDFVKTLFEETNAKYVEPEHELTFLKSNPEQFIWWSERDGYNHLYLYHVDGTLIRQLTQGKFVVTDFLGFDLKEEKFFFRSTQESPIERHLYCASLKGGKAKKLTNGAGTHSLTHTKDMAFFLDNFSSTVVPRKNLLINMDGVPLSELFSAENPLEEYKTGEMTLGTIKSDEGTDLYYRLFKPVDFDPKKKYPVVVYLYNGPHVQLVNNTWLGGANLWYTYLTQKGFVVFTIDGRGSANRGFHFESSVHRQLGELEMKDQLTGLDWLKKKSWVDGERVGIHGWSFGGFMTTSLLCKHPDVFKVGVAGGPVIDWHYYEIMYTERYMDSPEQNADGYAQANLLNHLDSLRTPLLMIHGAQDDVVLWQHSLMFLEKAIKQNNTYLDYYVYPHHPHNVRGRDRLHLYGKVTEYLVRELK